MWRNAIVLITCSLVAGCDSGAYTAVTGTDGTVVIVNRYTGSVRRVQGNSILELDGPGQPHRVLNLSQAAIPKQPISVRGIARYRDENMVLRLRIEASPSPKDTKQWEAWRSHLMSLRATAQLNLNFVDSDGFRVATRPLQLSELEETVDSNRDLIGLSTQLEMPMSKQAFNAVNDWEVGWSGYWGDFEPIPPEPPATDSKSGT